MPVGIIASTIAKLCPFCDGMWGDFMRRIVVDMQNVLFSDAIAKTLQNTDLNFSVYISEHPDETLRMCADTEADILIMEVTAYSPWKLSERMKIRDVAKAQNPDLRLVLVVDENTEKKMADQVREAKKDGLIDNFIYGSVSATYLSAVIDTL